MTGKGERRRVTMRDVAEAAGVPVSAVALALADKSGVSAERRAAVQQAADEIGYERHSRPKRPLFGLVMEELSPAARSDGFIDTLLHGVYGAARSSRASIALTLYHRGADPVAELRELAGRELDGVIVANGGDITVDVIDEISAHGLPTVLMENRVDRPISSVSSDNFTAGLASTKHLIDLGHRKIAVIQGSSRYSSLRDRLRGHLIALNEAGIEPRPEFIPAPAEHAERKGYQETLRLLDSQDRPTAIYAVSDKTAFGAAAAIADRGLQVGTDISLVGTDNVDASAYQSRPLTTFDTHASTLGSAALNALFSIQHGSTVVTHSVVEGSLHVRASSGPPVI